MTAHEGEQLRDLTRRERGEVGRSRLRQGTIVAHRQAVQDSDGNIGAPYLALSTLALLERHGTITREQRTAGDEFHRVFQLAQLDALKAADMARVPVCGGNPEGLNGNERARKKIRDAIIMLGGSASIRTSCAWHILGEEQSLRQWATERFAGKKQEAVGVLVVVLEALTPHFGD